MRTGRMLAKEREGYVGRAKGGPWWSLAPKHASKVPRSQPSAVTTGPRGVAWAYGLLNTAPKQARWRTLCEQ